jgi:transitional endoplasmic reticulum ATPase
VNLIDTHISDPMRLGRVRETDDQGRPVVVEFTNGEMATLTHGAGSVLRLPTGAVVLVEADTGYIEEVSQSLWPDPAWVGIVRLKLDDVTVVEAGSGYRLIETTATPAYEVGNTVAGREKGGIYRILDTKPLRLIDLSGVDDSMLAAFEPAVSGSLTFRDFAGLPQVVARARELIEVPLTHRERLAAIGAKPIKGVLFTGQPGTGKTHLARIIAHEAKAKFYEISGPQVFSKWFGESEALLRRLFERAAEHERSIIFFDEIDSVAAQREGAHEASARVVAQLLTLMDGFERTDNIIVIAATNRPETIDPALRRPGRFDVEIHFPLPDLSDRLALLHYAASTHATQGDLPLESIARRTTKWSGAELTAIWSDAALLAARDERDYILGDDLIGGFQRVALQHGRSRLENREGEQ